MVEYYAQYPDRLIPALHYGSASPWSTRTNNDCRVYEPSRFHTYGLEWTPTTLTVTIDGTTCLEHRIDPEEPLTAPQPFDRPFNLNLTQMLGSGENSVPEGATATPRTMSVDYVRVWR